MAVLGLGMVVGAEAGTAAGVTEGIAAGAGVANVMITGGAARARCGTGRGIHVVLVGMTLAAPSDRWRPRPTTPAANRPPATETATQRPRL